MGFSCSCWSDAVLGIVTKKQQLLILTKVKKIINKTSAFQSAALVCSGHCLGESPGKQSTETKED